MLDRSRLSREEAEELRHALRDRRQFLADRDRIGSAEAIRTGARWRLFVVDVLLAELDG